MSHRVCLSLHKICVLHIHCCSAKHALNVRISGLTVQNCTRKFFFVVVICAEGALTYSLVVGVQQLHEGCWCSLCIDELCRLFIQGQLTQDTSCYPLNILHIRVEQLQKEWMTYISRNIGCIVLYVPVLVTNSKDPQCQALKSDSSYIIRMLQDVNVPVQRVVWFACRRSRLCL